MDDNAADTIRYDHDTICEAVESILRSLLAAMQVRWQVHEVHMEDADRIWVRLTDGGCWMETYGPCPHVD